MNNISKPLFSDHYLHHRIQSTSEWQEDINHHFEFVQNLYQQKRDILPNLNESQTENEFIQPLFDRLGFNYIVQTSLHKSGKIQRPDYALFLDENSKQIAYNSLDNETIFYGNAVSIADAKYWERNLSDKLKNEQKDTFKNSNPSFQIVNYLDGTRVNWGILTNGRFWRLYYRLSSSPIQEFYESDLVKILVDNDVEKFKYFWLFFRKEAFIKDSQNLNFLERVKEESNSYARRIEGELKRLIFKDIFANLAQGFLASQLDVSPPTPLSNGSLNRENLIYQATLSFLYKILFLLYAEAKNLLPIDQESYREYSLSNLLKKIAIKCDQNLHFSETSTQYYDNLLGLFKIIDKGDRALNVPAYNGGLFKFDFSGEDDFFTQRRKGAKVSINNFLLRYKVADHILAPVLDKLARINGEFIDYKFLGVRELGSIYEGLLEYKFVIDTQNNNQLFLTNDKGERKETGSYYTPEYIVNYIVQNTLDPILQVRETQFHDAMNEINKLLKQLQDSRKSAKTIQLLRQDLDNKKRQAYNILLDIKVCDPAMGSGHFLVTTVDYLTRKIINIINHYPENNPILEQLENIKNDIIHNLTKQGIYVNQNSLSPDNLLHRAVMKRCIYGVDLNPMAVELAKVSLWLHSFTVGAPLSFLDHHLRCGNSLIGCMAKDVQNEFICADETEGFLPLFQTPFHGLLQSANVMQEIANLSDATFEQVEQSQHYFNSFDDQAKPYKQLLDVYISQYFGLKKKEVESFFRFRLNNFSGNSQEIFDNVNQDDQLLLDTAKNLYETKRFFHWDLEFPEVFIDLTHSNWQENGGFDAVLGNPPYIRSIRLKEFDSQSWQYYPLAYEVASKREYDIYLCFIEQSLKLINNVGYSGLIIPNKWFTTRVGESIRNLLASQKVIKYLVDFKDYQIFAEATTYICLLFLSKNFAPPQPPLLRGENVEQKTLIKGEKIKEKNPLINGKNIEKKVSLTKGDLEGLNHQFYIAILDNYEGVNQPLPNIEGNWKMRLFDVNDLGLNSWNFALDKTQSLFKKLANLPKIEDIASKIFKGLGTSADNIFRMEKKDHQFYSRSLETLVTIEPELIKPSLTGQNINSYNYDRSHYLLFPYDCHYKLIDANYFEKNYPLAWQYLNHEINTKILLDRNNGKYIDKQDWYAYSFLNNIKILNLPKIIFPDVTNRAKFVCDFDGHYIIDTVYAMQLKEGVKISLLALTAILNSKILTFFLQQTGTNLRGGYFRMKTAYINPFPIPNITFNTSAKKKENEINKLTQIYHHTVKQASSLSNLICNNIMELVKEYLALNQSDIIHDFLAFLAQQMMNFNQQKQTEIKEFLIWLAREIGTEIENLTNKTAIKNYLGDYQKQEDSLTLNELLDILKKNRKKLTIDASERKFQNLLAKEYEASLNTLFPIKQQLIYTDYLLDRIVYNLYGLTEEEINLIDRQI